MTIPRILMVDDHVMVRKGVRLLLSEQGLACELLEADSCAAALTFLAGNDQVDWVLLDLGLPDAVGVEALVQLRARFPQVPVVVVSAAEDRALVLECINHGAMGFIVKSTTSAVFVNALRLVFAGGIYLPPAVLGQHLPDRLAPPGMATAGNESSLAATGLTERQLQVLALMVRGLPNKTIARRLHLAEATVKNHIAASLKAFGAKNRTQALFAVAKSGLLTDIDLRGTAAD